MLFRSDIKDEGQTITVEIPKVKTPKTGDDKNYGTWIGLALVGIVGVVTGVIFKIKSKKEEEDE